MLWSYAVPDEDRESSLVVGSDGGEWGCHDELTAVEAARAVL
jgi:hypothetical protein